MTRRGEDSIPAQAVPSAGEQLRAGREARRWSAQDAASRLRIRPAFIEALERDDYAPFGATAYARGHLRNYARLLGLDEQALLQDLRHPAGDGRGKPLRRAPELHPGRPWLVRLGGLAIIGALAVLGALWAGARSPQAPALTTPPGTAAAPQDTASPPSPSAVAPATPLPESDIAPPPIPRVADTQPAATRAMPEPTGGENPLTESAPPAVNPAPGSASAELRLRSRAVSWVEVTDRSGQRLVYDLISPGPQRTVHGEPPLRLLLGNAPAVDVLYNGAPVALPAGQHVVRMTLGSAPPQPAPLPAGTPPPGAAPPVTTP